ncbi:MAG: MbcA/ParS/Xre antitoxin family protein [Burkholderiaceae bacterium]|nr:MbcA/ParS/Xre antitoxin family protein [Burkholderiaceae bacterium]
MIAFALRQPEADAAEVLTKAAVRAAAMLGLQSAVLAKVIGVSDSTVSRYKAASAGIVPQSKSGQLALLLIRVFRSLDPLVGADDARRKAWMRTPNMALGGVPEQLIQSPDGLVRTLDYLDGMRAVA